MIKVLIQQPVIPAYRVAVFSALADRADLACEVHASMQAPGCPDTCSDEFAFAFHAHPCRTLWNGAAFWQAGLGIPSHFGPGDVLVASGNPRFLSTLRLILQAKRRRLGIVWWGHGWSASSKPLRASPRRVLMRLLADAWLLYTQQEVERYEALGFASNRLFAANNTIDCSPMDAAIGLWEGPRGEEFRVRERIEKNRMLLFCGRLTEKPGLGKALEALALLLARDSRYTLVVIGDGPERAGLERVAQQLGIGDRVRWLGALYDEGELAPWFLSAACFVYPGAIGLSLLHAFAYGLPVVTHDDAATQCPEFAALRDGHNGRTYRHGSVENLAQAIQSLTERPDLRDEMGRHARETMRRNYSIERMVESFHRAIRGASSLALRRRSK
jgi:glycosyltransferase involved in cell wall biosynthesis